MLKKTKRQEGFTLIELLVVVVIIGILASVALPNLMGAQDKAKNSGVQSNAHAIQLAIEAYRVDHADAYPVDLSLAVSDTLYAPQGGFPKTPWNTQQSSVNANIAIPTQGLNQMISNGAMVTPTANTHYGAICYTRRGSAGEEYELSGIGKIKDSAFHVYHSQNF